MRLRKVGAMKLFFILSTVLVGGHAVATPHTVKVVENFHSLGPMSVSANSGVLGKVSPLSSVDKEASANAAYLEATARKLVDFSKFESTEPMEPLRLDSLNANIQLSNFIVTGLDKFKLKDIKLRLYENDTTSEPFRADLEVLVPVLNASVDYTASLLSTNEIASGNIKAILENVRLQVAAQTTTTQVFFFEVFQVKSYKMNAKTDNLKVQLQVEQDPRINDDEKFILQLIKSAKDEVAQYACRFAVKEANKVLENVPKTIIMDLLVSSPALLQSIIDQVL